MQWVCQTELRDGFHIFYFGLLLNSSVHIMHLKKKILKCLNIQCRAAKFLFSERLYTSL